MKSFLTLYSILFTSLFIAQNSCINFGANSSGLCFGNPQHHNGIKLNTFDKNVNKVNGINLAILSRSKTVNGLSIGLFAALDSCSNGIKIGCLGSDAGYHNGLVIGGLKIIGEKINGIGVALWTVSADTMNGAFICLNGGVSKWSTRDTIKLLNGVAVGMLDVSVKNMNGFATSLFFNNFENMNGISISLVNKTKTLHGFQFGLINYAANNKALFQWIPFFNFNFKKPKEGES